MSLKFFKAIENLKPGQSVTFDAEYSSDLKKTLIKVANTPTPEVAEFYIEGVDIYESNGLITVKREMA